MKYRITTQRQLRREFWEAFPEHAHAKASPQQSCDTRCAFVDWIDSLQKDGKISESLAQRATL